MNILGMSVSFSLSKEAIFLNKNLLNFPSVKLKHQQHQQHQNARPALARSVSSIFLFTGK